MEPIVGFKSDPGKPWSFFYKPCQSIDVSLPSLKGDILVEVKRNVPGRHFLETKRVSNK